MKTAKEVAAEVMEAIIHGDHGQEGGLFYLEKIIERERLLAQTAPHTSSGDEDGLVRRLLGEYRIPVNDGAGPAEGEGFHTKEDGSQEFVRTFPVTPIHREAAARIKLLLWEKMALHQVLNFVADGWKDTPPAPRNPAYEMWARARNVVISLAPLRGTAGGQRWRHIKRGSSYVQLGIAHLQASNGAIPEGEVLVIYQNADGLWFAREINEFTDGRFTAIDT